ncbi:protein of unknown function [Granulicatella balaenopterae]|uniref:DUF4868 domain-containing protein n=1 Tax=Granulicatella balaenopterae TaxID=137733 RepID=A0A1H9NIR4_9LACT|nr:Kiwa anti-phage protein KwaB-like domain-containing protein [Granulicatella balaenopterae]SER35850.1 protein of unknown function [Granulicatella balaenopterae]
MNGKFMTKFLDTSYDINQLSLDVYMIRHVTQQEKYAAKIVNLGKLKSGNEADDLNNWLKKSIQRELEQLKKDDSGEIKHFIIKDFDTEIFVQDAIAKIDLNQLNEYGEIYERFELLKQAINEENSEKINRDIINTSFQVCRLTDTSVENDLEETMYVFYYRGIKKQTSSKKTCFFRNERVNEIKDDILDIGGKISFIILNNYIYIFKTRDFEYAFKFYNHIIKKRDENIQKISNLSCFSDNVTKELFIKKASNNFYSRGLAKMNEKGMEKIENYYNQRCIELKKMVEKLDSLDEKQKENLKSDKGELIEVIQFIDFAHGNKITITEEDNISPLLHLFQDKIVESFLTKEIRTTKG